MCYQCGNCSLEHGYSADDTIDSDLSALSEVPQRCAPLTAF